MDLILYISGLYIEFCRNKNYFLIKFKIEMDYEMEKICLYLKRDRFQSLNPSQIETKISSLNSSLIPALNPSQIGMEFPSLIGMKFPSLNLFLNLSLIPSQIETDFFHL